MSLHPEHKKPQSAWQDLAIFAAVIGFLGYSVYAFLGFTRIVPQRVPSSLEMAALEAPSDRRPASNSPPGTGSTEILRTPCFPFPSSTPLSLQSGARLVQIHAALCPAKKGDASSLRAANEASGEEIMVFVNGKEKSLSTSYFSLKDGNNQIVFTEDLGAGRKRVDKIQVIRKAD